MLVPGPGSELSVLSVASSDVSLAVESPLVVSPLVVVLTSVVSTSEDTSVESLLVVSPPGSVTSRSGTVSVPDEHATAVLRTAPPRTRVAKGYERDLNMEVTEELCRSQSDPTRFKQEAYRCPQRVPKRNSKRIPRHE